MRNVIVLGSGRSGTSMVAGSLAAAGYFLGHDLLPPSPSNPKGFFEDVEVNAINEDILESVVPRRPRVLGNTLFKDRPLRYQRWLARVPLSAQLQSKPAVDERIKKVVSNVPFCLKDPRFSYTLPLWRPFLENTVFVCVFRHPTATATSILRECRDDVRLHSLAMNTKRALQVWTLMYRHVLEIHRHTGSWLFLHYDQMVAGDGLDKIASLAQAKVDRAFPEKRLQRTVATESVLPEVKQVYETLCSLAGY